ncbi:unnamed protein product [Arctia plantaginis]|uniref:SFR19-like C-terminal domain-containing protein n=1 Tax=Arctia plantaginis TaxID=874455 RepID=A0A8S1B7V7_ARCPL|nr:unnamed protein product [Arctia plantaginis]
MGKEEWMGKGGRLPQAKKGPTFISPKKSSGEIYREIEDKQDGATPPGSRSRGPNRKGRNARAVSLGARGADRLADARRAAAAFAARLARRRARRPRWPARRSPVAGRGLGGLAPAVAAHAAARPEPPEPSAASASSSRHRSALAPSRERSRGTLQRGFHVGRQILVSVSFKDQERASGDERREGPAESGDGGAGRTAAPDPETVPRQARPHHRPGAVALPRADPVPAQRDRTPERRRNASLPREASGPAAVAAAPAESAHGAVGPKPAARPAAPPAAPPPTARRSLGGRCPPPRPAGLPGDAYDPYERLVWRRPPPPPPAPPPPPRALMTLEAAQKTNLSADDVIDRRPLSPIEKVMALLQSTRDVPPDDPPPGEAAGVEGAASEATPAPAPAPAPAAPPSGPPVRIVLPSPTRAAAPKLFLAKPSPIKSDPIKPMPAAKIARPAPPAARRGDSELGGDSPYSPGSSDFGDLFEPPGGGRDAFDAVLERPPRSRKPRSAAAKVPVKLNRKKGKTQVGVKIDEDNLKILDDLPSSAVEMQVKSKFLKKLNRQERVVEEVKLVLKPHYNKKHVTKDEYKEILRRTVPKICHNKTGEINPSKIQALVEAYVKKFRKKHKLGLV